MAQSEGNVNIGALIGIKGAAIPEYALQEAKSLRAELALKNQRIVELEGLLKLQQEAEA